MGWTDESGRHEGYVKVVFADGRLGGGVMSSKGLSVDGPDGLAARDTQGEYEWRPEAAVVGWRLACDHVPAHVADEDLGRYRHTTEQWMSPVIWRRVYSPADEDLAGHRVCVPLDDTDVHIDDREDVWEILLAEWRTHLEPEDHARSIRTATATIESAHQQRDLEVLAARAAGLSWADIGRAAGMTRQAARDRWGSPRLLELARAYVAAMASYQDTLNQATAGGQRLGYDIAANRSSAQLVKLKEQIEALGGSVQGRAVVGPDDQVVAIVEDPAE